MVAQFTGGVTSSTTTSTSSMTGPQARAALQRLPHRDLLQEWTLCRALNIVFTPKWAFNQNAIFHTTKVFKTYFCLYQMKSKVMWTPTWMMNS